jgi:predicted DNA-binding transcriptional regulator YafY
LRIVSDISRSDIRYILYERRMNIVRESLEQGQNLWIKYLSTTNAEITDRIITPKDLVVFGSHKNLPTHLFAFCHSAQDERNFHLERILDVRIVNSSKV